MTTLIFNPNSQRIKKDHQGQNKPSPKVSSLKDDIMHPVSNQDLSSQSKYKLDSIKDYLEKYKPAQQYLFASNQGLNDTFGGPLLPHLWESTLSETERSKPTMSSLLGFIPTLHSPAFVNYSLCYAETNKTHTKVVERYHSIVVRASLLQVVNNIIPESSKTLWNTTYQSYIDELTKPSINLQEFYTVDLEKVAAVFQRTAKLSLEDRRIVMEEESSRSELEHLLKVFTNLCLNLLNEIKSSYKKYRDCLTLLHSILESNQELYSATTELIRTRFVQEEVSVPLYMDKHYYLTLLRLQEFNRDYVNSHSKGTTNFPLMSHIPRFEEVHSAQLQGYLSEHIVLLRLMLVYQYRVFKQHPGTKTWFFNFSSLPISKLINIAPNKFFTNTHLVSKNTFTLLLTYMNTVTESFLVTFMKQYASNYKQIVQTL